MKTRLWQVPTSQGPDLSTLWWGQLLLALVLWALCTADARAQIKQWDKTFGSNKADYLSSLLQTRDGGYILGGISDADSSGDKTENSRGDYDFWVVKLDAEGNKMWDKTLGGSEGETLAALLQTQDGGYLLGGYSNSGISGEKTENSRGRCEYNYLCSYDFWVVKLDAAGNKVWDKTFGGGNYEFLSSLLQTQDGGYILGGTSGSDSSGDKTAPSRGYADYWVVRLDAAGNKQWDKTFGGNNDDRLSELQLTNDGGYILGGSSNSGSGGDKTEPNSGYSVDADYWVVKLDSAGNKMWDKTLGGNGIEGLYSLRQTRDGGYILGGVSESDSSRNKSENRRGPCLRDFSCPDDFWVVKLDAAGNKQWDKTIGSDVDDYFGALQQTSDGGYLLGGYTWSDVTGDKTQPGPGGFDYWLVKLDATGKKLFDKPFGGFHYEYLYDFQVTRDGGYILGGFSDSDISGDKTENRWGECERPYYGWTCPGDFWVLKLTAEAPMPQLQAFSPIQGLPGTLVTLTGQHLATTRAVLFNGLAADFEVVSDSVAKATVPANAASGNIKLETEGGQATSSTVFTVLQPEILVFTPVQGRVGDRVYLAGNRLATTREVYFNGVRSPRVKVYSDWAIRATVPDGATTGQVRVVLTGGGTDITKSEFVVVPEAAPVMATQALASEETPGKTSVPGKMEAARVLAYPNPFQQQVTFSFTLAQAQPVVVKVYDLLGREVSLLYQGEARGRQAYQLEWRPPTQLPAGPYIIRLQTPIQVSQHKVLLVR